MGIDIPTYMIIIKDNPISEYYASSTIPVWTKNGYNVTRYAACTPENLPLYFKLNLGQMKNDRYRARGIFKEFTPGEIGCWYSHVALWKKCIDLNEKILILEHDSYLFFPEYMNVSSKYDFVTFSEGTACYIISPKFASFLWKRLAVEHLPINVGPYGYIDDIIKRNRLSYKGILQRDHDYIKAAFQVHNPKYGATIDHYKNTAAEDLKDIIGPTERVLLTENETPNVDNIIFTIAG